jgi:hypothetical protein
MSSGARFVVEATVVGGSDAQTAEARRKAEVFGVIDRLKTLNFYLSVDVHKVGPSSPPAAKLSKALER